MQLSIQRTLRLVRQVTCVAAMTVAVPGVALAQDSYPARPVTIINPNAPGGIVDIVARTLATALQKSLKQSVIVVNRGGANGAIGTQAAAIAPADGYTLLLTTPSLLSVPEVDRLFDRTPLYAVDQFMPIARITSDPTVVIAHPSLGASTIAELVAIAKVRPDGVVMASSGTYGATHLPLAMIEMRTGIRMRHVATSGGGPAFAMTLGGHSQIVASAPGVAFPQVQAGKLRALAQTGSARVAAFGDTPTLKESGIDVEYYLWTVLFAPAKTPAAILKTLTDAARQAADDEQFRGAIAKSNSNLTYAEGDALRAFLARETSVIGATVRHIGKIEDAK
jgi:tripartite-type tricarboxylate transporter receptor subunit TctC